jgi:hypothetical protein
LPAVAELVIGFAVCAGIALRAPVSIDYSKDAGPGIHALLHGGWTELSAQPLMGPVSLVVRAPLVALVQALGGDDLMAYRVGAIPCLFAAAEHDGATGVHSVRAGAPAPALGRG